MSCPARALALCAAMAWASPALAQQHSITWETMPRMVLERQYAGPLRDTIIQRWRDPADGAICYIYLPISAPHTPLVPGTYVNYGSQHDRLDQLRSRSARTIASRGAALRAQSSKKIKMR